MQQEMEKQEAGFRAQLEAADKKLETYGAKVEAEMNQFTGELWDIGLAVG